MTKKAKPEPKWEQRFAGEDVVPAADLVANPHNFRKHPKAQRAAMTATLDTVGWIQRVIVNRTTGRIVDGHLRVEEAAARGESVPVVYVELSEDEERAALLTFDPLGALAQEDTSVLDELLADHRAIDLDVDRGNMVDLLYGQVVSEGLTDPDAVPDVPEPVTKPGDLWALGDHRLLCGDATDAADTNRLLDGAQPGLMVTDPPYGVNYDPNWRTVEAEKGNLAFAPTRVGKIANDDRSDWGEAWSLFPGTVVYAWHPAGATSLVHAVALQDSGFVIRMQIIWAKSNFPIGRGDYHVRHEPCWYAVKKGEPARRTEDRTQTTLWEINLDKNVEGGHSAQKPVECMARAIRNHSFEDVYDPFVGSGTTIVAAEQLGRRCYAIDIDPVYVDVTVRRWEEFTGRKAELVT